MGSLKQTILDWLKVVVLVGIVLFLFFIPIKSKAVIANDWGGAEASLSAGRPIFLEGK